MKVSEKNIISIRKFITNYILIEFNEDCKITHEFLIDYLNSKGIIVPNKVYYKSITKDDVLKGNIIFVCDERNKVVPYKNPYLFNKINLLKELKNTTKRIKKQVVQKEKEEELLYKFEHCNRIKVLQNKRTYRRNKYD